jgi:hypothetical protein
MSGSHFACGCSKSGSTARSSTWSPRSVGIMYFFGFLLSGIGLAAVVLLS